MDELKKHPFEIEKGRVYGSGHSDISDLICMMPCYGIMADVSAQSQHICSGVRDCEHQWSHWLCQHYWFVVVVVWVVVGLGGVSPPFEPKPTVENNSGALQCVPCVYIHEYLFVHLVHNSSSVDAMAD